MKQDNLEIAVRSYVSKEDGKRNNLVKSSKHKKPSSSKWVLLFDTETTIDASQKLRFGTYQICKGKDLHELGIFYDPNVIQGGELFTLKSYANKHNHTLRTVSNFIEEIFYVYGYAFRGSIVGFNLPFDISRLAIGHNTARTTKHNNLMQNGFTFQLSENTYQPRVQVKHISSRNSFIRFAAIKGQRATRGDRKKGKYQSIRRGFFIDVRTLSAALTSQSHSLDSLAKSLKVSGLKHETEEHGKELSEAYISYAVQNTQTTWECYEKLNEMYEKHDLKKTDVHNIKSKGCRFI